VRGGSGASDGQLKPESSRPAADTRAVETPPLPIPLSPSGGEGKEEGEGNRESREN